MFGPAARALVSLPEIAVTETLLWLLNDKASLTDSRASQVATVVFQLIASLPLNLEWRVVRAVSIACESLIFLADGSARTAEHLEFLQVAIATVKR